MTPADPAGTALPQPQLSLRGAAASQGRRRRRRWLGLTLFLLLASACALAWWLRSRPPIPPLPDGGEDPEVRAVIDEARLAVLAAPRAADAWGHYAKVLFAQLFDRDAEICFAEANRLNPADPRWLYCRSVILLKRDPERGLPLLRQARAAADDSWPALRSIITLKLADELINRGQLDEAEQCFRAEAVRDPGSLHVAMGLGLIAHARGDTTTAARLYGEAQACPSACKFATAQLAKLARERGDRAAAEAYESQASKLPMDPLWPDSFMDEIASMRVGQRAFERRVHTLEVEKRWAEALRLYLQRLETWPDAELYIGAGKSAAQLRDYDRAFELLRQAVRLEPDNANAQFTLALVLFSRAERDWYTTPAAPAVKAWFNEALAHAQRAAEIRPGHATTYMVWGLALKFLGRPAQAIVPLRLGVACQPTDLELQLGLGQVLAAAGHDAEARQHLEKARSLAPPNDPRPAAALARLSVKNKS
jgi:tetratricopeptide (TPR) repeat protein